MVKLGYISTEEAYRLTPMCPLIIIIQVNRYLTYTVTTFVMSVKSDLLDLITSI